jgi:hypothetical protein
MQSGVEVQRQNFITRCQGEKIMSKSSSVFVVDFGDYYQEVRGAFTSLDAAKDYVLSEVLLDVLDGDEYVDGMKTVVLEYQGVDLVNQFEVSCEGFDRSIGKVKNRNKVLETLDLRCVTHLSPLGDR